MRTAEAEQPDHREQEVAVVALAGRFPGARDVEQLWENLRGGVESIRTFGEEELLAAGVTPEELRHPDYVRAGGVLDGAELFDAAFFGYSPREAEVLDPQHRVFLECAWEALERAGYGTEAYPGPVAVFAGVTASTYLLFHLLPDREVVRRAGRTALGLANDKDYLATRVSYKLDLKGPSFTVQTACSTSLVAVHLACQSLLNGECDLALAGGVSVPVPQETGYLYERQGILSPDGHCRAFDAAARGTVGGRGAGVVVLKRLLDALADGDLIHAVIKGSGINNDGAAKVGFTAPSVEGQAGVIAEALALADVDPETVTYVEAHGTGTELGDPIEVEALTRVFRARTSRRGFCALGSIKTNVGHLDAAAGVAGLIKAVLALEHEAIPPSLHFERPNPAIDFAQSPFFVNAELRPWPRGPVPRRAGVSSFGLGGTNAHVVLEEAPEPEPASPPARRWQLLLLSARTETALEAATANLAGYLRRPQRAELADVAFTTHVGRRAFEQRRVLVCRDAAEAAAALADPRSREVLTRSCRPGDRPVAFLFSGLGEQYEGMAGELYRDEPAFREVFDRCGEILRPHLGADLREVVYPGGEEAFGATGTAAAAPDLRRLLAVERGAAGRLDRTLYAQPALFVLEYALARLWMSWGVTPEALLGYSVGEYVAACLAGVLSLEDALRLVAGRARLIDGLPAGSMLAVPLSEAAVGAWLPAGSDQGLALAAVNGPELCVVAGPEESIAALETRLREAGLVSRRLRTTHAFHSPDLAPVAGELTRLASSLRLRAPEIPFLSNVTGTWITAAEATDPGYWARHLTGTVRFGDAAAELWRAPGRVVLEVGPGQSLVSLALQNRPAAEVPGDGAAVPSLPSAHERVSGSAHLLSALGQLWLAGVKVDWAGFHAGEGRRRVELPTYPFERRRHWVDLAAAAPVSEPAGPPAGKDPEIARWFFSPGWKPAPPPERRPEAAPAAWLLVGAPASGEGPAAGLERALARRLAEEGRRVVTARFGDRFERTAEDAFVLRPREAEDYRALVAALPAADGGPWAAVHLGSLTGIPAPDRGGPGLFDELQAAGYYSLLFLVQAWAPAGAGLRLAAVADGLFDVSGGDPLVPEKAPLAALCKVVPQEHPAIRCRCLDVRPAATAFPAVSERLIAEVELASPEVFAAWRGARRWVEVFEPVRLEAAAPARRRLRPGGVYLLLGGLGGIGLRVAELLARTAGARLVLAGRSPFPPREEWDAWLAARPADDPVCRRIVRLRRIEALGGEVRTVQADAADEAQVRAAVAAADDDADGFGALHGVFHCAGITRGPSLAPLAALGAAESEVQFRAKVRGLYALERALEGREVDFCYLFSSASAVLGGLGLAAYSAASLFLDAFALDRNAGGRGVWLTSDWDPWPAEEVADEEEGAAPEPGTAGSSVEQYTMTPAEAAEALRRVLLYGPEHTVVATGDLEARADVWLRGAGREEKSGARHPRNLPTPYVAPRNETERILAGLWQEYLGIQPVGVHDNFFQLGGHSLMGMRLRAALEQTFRVELPMAAILQSPTVAEIAVAVEIALIEMLSGSDDLEEAVR